LQYCSGWVLIAKSALHMQESKCSQYAEVRQMVVSRVWIASPKSNGMPPPHLFGYEGVARPIVVEFQVRELKCAHAQNSREVRLWDVTPEAARIGASHPLAMSDDLAVTRGYEGGGGADDPGRSLHRGSWHAGAAGGEGDSGQGADKDGDRVDAAKDAMEFQATLDEGARKTAYRRPPPNKGLCRPCSTGPGIASTHEPDLETSDAGAFNPGVSSLLAAASGRLSIHHRT
jgi:hypothetical protein